MTSGLDTLHLLSLRYLSRYVIYLLRQIRVLLIHLAIYHVFHRSRVIIYLLRNHHILRSHHVIRFISYKLRVPIHLYVHLRSYLVIRHFLTYPSITYSVDLSLYHLRNVRFHRHRDLSKDLHQSDHRFHLRQDLIFLQSFQIHLFSQGTTRISRSITRSSASRISCSIIKTTTP